MKIILANYRYFVSGGPERYMFNVMDALSSGGHEVIPFSINYVQNQPTPYSSYFVKPLGERDEVAYRQQKLTAKTCWLTLKRLFYDPGVEKAILKIARDTKPDIAYILAYLRKLSPALLVGLKRMGLPVVVRISDYGMVCPAFYCLRNGKPCELCLNGRLWPSIRYGCVQNSLGVSVINGLATWYHWIRGYFDLIDVFIVTNFFMFNILLKAGFPRNRLRCIPTFVNNQSFQPAKIKANYFIYLGRLSKEKGVSVLLEAMAILKNNRPNLKTILKIVGSGDNSYTYQLEKEVEGLGLEQMVEFVGENDVQKISLLLSRALVSVVPSLWYENMPNSILESYSCGTAVLASNLGSLIECVIDGETGYLFKRGDSLSLANKLEFCLDNHSKLKQMGKMARKLAELKYSPKHHMIAIIQLFKELINKE